MNITKHLLVIALIAFTLLLCFSSCETEKIVIEKEVVYITDTLTIVDTVTITEIVTETIIKHSTDTATTFILVKHAETSGISTDRSLSSTGRARAQELSRILSNVPLAAVFSTNYNRTRGTASPTATNQSINLETYGAFDLDLLADNNLTDHHGEIVLVVGHSNTIPSLANILIGEDTYSDFSETEFDNLFIITVVEKGRSKVVHMKYGN